MNKPEKGRGMRNFDGALKKPHMPVYSELPNGALEGDYLAFLDYRQARGYVNGEYKTYYYCPKCEGWIEGYPTIRHENTLQPHVLAGRQGRSDNCERCGYELHFMGFVS